MHRRALDEKKTYDTWQQGLLQIFEAVQENKPFILNVYRCVHREQVEKYLQPLVDQLLLDVIEEEASGMMIRDEDKQFIAQGLRLYFYWHHAGLDQGRYAGRAAGDRRYGLPNCCKVRSLRRLQIPALRWLR